jgi:hypothetical protein
MDTQFCDDCREWENGHFGQPLPDKCVIILEKAVIESLADELRDLELDSDFFKIPRKQMQSLKKHWQYYEHECYGQGHRWYNLAELLNLFRGADILHSEAIQEYGDKMLRPMPKKYVTMGAYLKPSRVSRNDFPNGTEPWLSTIIRTVLKKYSSVEGKPLPYVSHGPLMRRHAKRRDDFVDEAGNWVDNWPVKRILQHRWNDEEEIEYQVQYIGFTLPGDVQWLARDELGERIWGKYDAEHGIEEEEKARARVVSRDNALMVSADDYSGPSGTNSTELDTESKYDSELPKEKVKKGNLKRKVDTLENEKEHRNVKRGSQEMRPKHLTKSEEEDREQD